MKKQLLALLCATASTALFAQTNLNLETWTGNEPSGFYTYNFLTNLGGPQSTFKETSNPGEGAASAKMITVNCAVCASFNMPTVLGGIISTGTLQGQSLKLGFAYTQRPTSIDFKYKSAPAAGDKGVVYAQLSRWDGSQKVPVGQGYFLADAQVTAWTNQNMPIQYFNQDAPDTMYILASSSAASALQGLPNAGTAAVGSELYIDAIVINNPSGIMNFSFDKNVAVFPNPASMQINFLVKDENNSYTVDIYDMTGKKIESLTFINSLSVLSVEKMPKGIYFYQIKSQSGENISSGKFSVVN